MKIKIYEYTKRGEKTLFAPHSHTTDYDSTKTKVAVFLRGKGLIKWPRRQVIEHEVECSDTFHYSECALLYKGYGWHVAVEYVKQCRITADIAADSYVCIARSVPDAAVLDEIQETIGFDIRSNTGRLICLGVFLFPICELDDFLKKEYGYTEDEHGSMQDFVTANWGEAFCQRMESLWKVSSETKQSEKQLTS
jgi:hypothetical protein